MSKGIELGLGIEADQAAQVRFELRHIGLSVLIMAVHSGEPHRAQTIARMRPISDDRIGLELIPIRSPMLAHAFNCNLWHSLPITLQGERAQEFRTVERASGSFDEWIGSYCGKQDPHAMRFIADEMRLAYEAGWRSAPVEIRAEGFDDSSDIDLGDNPARILRKMITAGGYELSADEAARLDAWERYCEQPIIWNDIGELPRDVVRLVLAAREIAFGGMFDPVDADLVIRQAKRDAISELDKASEAFADRVPWDDDPEEADD